jgi:AcrR family transcriptional regulator
MKKLGKTRKDHSKGEEVRLRRTRADAHLKITAALLEAAVKVFAKSGVDAPVREIAEAAGVGLGTVYRHFPQRADLIAAVFQSQVDACAEAAPVMAGQYEPGEALARWMERYVDFIGTKRGLAAALHSGDPTYSSLPKYFDKRLQPALRGLLEEAVRAHAIRPGIEVKELLGAVGTLCCQGPHMNLDSARRMVSLLIDGMRYGVEQGTRSA